MKPKRLTVEQATQRIKAGQCASQTGYRDGKRFVWRNLWAFDDGATIGQFAFSLVRRRLSVIVTRVGGIQQARYSKEDD